MPEDREDDDKSIVDALSALGWVEEKEEIEDSAEVGEDLQSQLKFFKEQYHQLTEEKNALSEQTERLKKEKEELSKENEKLKQTTFRETSKEKIHTEADKDVNKVREMVGLPPLRPVKIPCLRCGDIFQSYDKRSNRLCSRCEKAGEDYDRYTIKR